MEGSLEGLKGAQIPKLLPSLGIFLGILIHGGASKKKRLRSQGSTAFRLRGSRGLDDEIRPLGWWDPDFGVLGFRV